jgi:predicted nuclease of predicted toxin-antitoxin system
MKIVCDEMVNPVLDKKLEKAGFKVFRPETSASDQKVLELAIRERSPILTRDRDFVRKHRKNENHYGILLDPAMHHRSSSEVKNAVEEIFDLMDDSDIENSVIRLKKFY